MNTKTDLIGARLCGLDKEYEVTAALECVSLITLKDGEPHEWLRDFSISNKADRMDVVEALGEKHGIAIVPTGSTSLPWCATNDGEIGIGGGDNASHEEATRAALESLADIYLKEGGA